VCSSDLKDDARFEPIIAAIKAGKLETIPDLVDIEASLRKKGLDVRDGLVHVAGEAMPSELNDRILEYQAANIPFHSLKKFWENLSKNPSFNSRKQLFKFLENKGHSITEDGCFIGYRGVTEDFKDVHTKTFDNSPGSVCEMPRELVNDNPDETCSNGLHVGGHEYAKTFGPKLVLVKVNPRDVVAVPNDYNGQKMRVCRFEVLKEAVGMVEDVVVSAKGEKAELNDFEDGYCNCEDCESESLSCECCGSYDDDCNEPSVLTAPLAKDTVASNPLIGFKARLAIVKKAQRYENNHDKRDKSGRFTSKKKAKKAKKTKRG
jgi:hypothetical protein